MKKKSMITILVIALMLVLSVAALSACDNNKDDPPATYSVTVNGGTGGGEYTAGATVKITANAPETGKEFTSWTIEGVTVDDKTNAEITFTMPANAVTATANYGDKAYLFALENCTADKETAKFGEQVTFTANEVEGRRFVGWNIKGVDDLTGLDLTKSPLTITMPANDINVAAVLEDIDYTVTVTGGTADKTTAHYGEQVTITANEPEAGKRFTGWTLDGVTVNDKTKAEITFTMPAGNVTATANYDFINYTVSVTGGTANKTTAHYGDSITITAAAPETGKEFTSWTIEGVTVENTSVTELTFTMPAGNVTATANYDFINYTVSVTGGTANKTTAHYGDSITITANEPEAGKRFTGWTLDGVTVEDLSAKEITFNMPANNVTATANYEYINYTVSVTGGTANKTTAHYGDSITITAEIPTGMSFAGWTLEGVTAETGGFSINFTMPANNVTATAKYVYNNYTVTVVGGTANKTTAHYGDSITITAEIPTGMSFVGWTLEGVTAETGGFSINFTMPANNVTATAKYVYNNYNVTVNGGKAQVNDGVASASVKAHYGEEVTITAEVPVGKEFVMWSFDGLVPDGLTLTDAELTFTMPANAVTATANYDFIDYTVTVTGGMAKVNGGVASASVKAHYGEEVTITAEVPVGKEFVMWSFDGLVPDGLTLTDAELTFTMPANAVTATANYDFIDYTVTVNGGTANKTTAHYGDSITITAAAPETGMKFTGWTLDGVTVNDKTKAEITFTMPANAVTATAVFEDIDYEVKVICRNTETKTAHYGEEVTITAENIEGKIFVCWGFTNLDTEGLDLTRAELSFTMPANNVTAKAIYEELITLTFEGITAQSEELRYKDNDSKSFRLPLGSGQDPCTYTIELSNSAFTFKVYGSAGEVIPYDNGDGTMCIDINREENYTIRVVNTGAAANCKLTVTQI